MTDGDDGSDAGESSEDPQTALQQSRRAELVLAVITGTLVLATVLTHGWVRLVLGVTSGLLAALLAWSLLVLSLVEALVHFLPSSSGKEPEPE